MRVNGRGMGADRGDQFWGVRRIISMSMTPQAFRRLEFNAKLYSMWVVWQQMDFLKMYMEYFVYSRDEQAFSNCLMNYFEFHW